MVVSCSLCTLPTHCQKMKKVPFFQCMAPGYGMDMFQCMPPSTKSWIRPCTWQLRPEIRGGGITAMFLFTFLLVIWLLTTPPHLKYAATLPCNLPLMACFAGINVSQGSVATYARCGGICYIRLTANLPRNLPVKFFLIG